nr:TolC family protein [Xylophilus sp.]
MKTQFVFDSDICCKNNSCLRPSTGRERPIFLKFSALLGALALAGCAVGPAYQPPTVDAPIAWKESTPAAGWAPFATPADALVRSDWWTLLGDDTLNQLAAQVQVSNQNIAAAVAATAQARALVNERNAALFPSLSVSGGAQRVGGDGRGGSSTNLDAALGASWEPDLWGRLGQLSGSAQASAQASAADLAAARLSALGTLASSYVQLRAADAEAALLQSTVQGFERSLQIARNRYAAGIAANTDVLQAQTQLANTRADLAGVQADRAKLEHAIAVLVGSAPAHFTLAPLATAWVPTVPVVPVGVPS